MKTWTQYQHYRTGTQRPTLTDVAFTVEDIQLKLKKLKTCKSPGPDGLHPHILKEYAQELSQPLYALFRRSLDEGCLPEDWKQAQVTLIFKKGNRHQPGNYRPVSLTAVVCKVMESIIHDHLTNHLDKNALLSEHQHGFTKGCSCITQLVETMEMWTSTLDEGGSINAIYLDFMKLKAFDKVPHCWLLSKLEA